MRRRSLVGLRDGLEFPGGYEKGRGASGRNGDQGPVAIHAFDHGVINLDYEYSFQ